MHLTLLGTGCPQVDTNRYGPATLVEAEGARVVIDLGSGVTQRLVDAGTSGAGLDLVLLTHLHSDHVIDLYQLIVSAWHQGRDRPQVIAGPPGTQFFVDAVMAVWKDERELRIAHERRPWTIAFDIEVMEIDDGWQTRVGPLEIRAVRVDHAPIVHAFGFVFDDGTCRAAVSGDTRYCPDLIGAARDVDLLVHECFIHREMQPVPGVRSPETVAAVAGYHTLSAEVGRVAREAGAKALALTHFVPTRFDREAVLAEVRQDYTGPILIGEDLMRIDVAGRSARYRDAVIAY